MEGFYIAMQEQNVTGPLQMYYKNHLTRWKPIRIQDSLAKLIISDEIFVFLREGNSKS